MAGNSSNTVSVATAIESLVGNAVPSSHVVVLIPDVSVALSPWDVGRMVVPLITLDFIAKAKLEFYKLPKIFSELH